MHWVGLELAGFASRRVARLLRFRSCGGVKGRPPAPAQCFFRPLGWAWPCAVEVERLHLMTQYSAVLIDRPDGWTPRSLDDVPPAPGVLKETIAEDEVFFDVVRAAMDYNGRMLEEDGRRWAVVVQKGCKGLTWDEARLCTPLRYQIATIWWPSGWEPQSPLDVPACVCQEQDSIEDRRLTYRQAVATVEGLNRQAMDRAGAQWYAIVVAENEPVSRSVTFDPPCRQTTVEVRLLHVAEPSPGAGRGNCEHCPARAVECPHMESVDAAN